MIFIVFYGIYCVFEYFVDSFFFKCIYIFVIIVIGFFGFMSV